MRRDEFSSKVKETLARRVAGKCSNPSCQAPTTGPHTDSSRSINVGVACHITAAASRGPRFDPKLSIAERSSIENAVWLCQTCSKRIDSDDCRYSVHEIRSWKVSSEAAALRALEGQTAAEYFPQPPSAKHVPIPKIGGLTYEEARPLLLMAGWQPLRSHWSHDQDLFMRFGNGRYFWGKGYTEIANFSGTGLAHCTFNFVDIYRNKLVVVTAGEVDEELESTAYVWSWYFEGDHAG
jgi:hypothetical protein